MEQYCNCKLYYNVTIPLILLESLLLPFWISKINGFQLFEIKIFINMLQYVLTLTAKFLKKIHGDTIIIPEALKG